MVHQLPKAEVTYPDCDGLPMSDNTAQLLIMNQPNLWQSKPWWCQPWTIILTGILYQFFKYQLQIKPQG
jgi:hypothetical protein